MSTMLAAKIIEEEGLEGDPAQALQDATTARAAGYTRIGGVAAVTTAINAAANVFPVMRPGTWFPFPVCGGGGGQAHRPTRPASQPPAGQAPPTDNRRRRRTKEKTNWLVRFLPVRSPSCRLPSRGPWSVGYACRLYSMTLTLASCLFFLVYLPALHRHNDVCGRRRSHISWPAILA